MVSMLLFEYYDQHNKHVLVYQHVLPIPVEDFVVQVTKSFDDDYDQHNKDDLDYQIEFPNLVVTRKKKLFQYYVFFFGQTCCLSCARRASFVVNV